MTKYATLWYNRFLHALSVIILLAMLAFKAWLFKMINHFCLFVTQTNIFLAYIRHNYRFRNISFSYTWIFWDWNFLKFSRWLRDILFDWIKSERIFNFLHIIYVIAISDWFTCYFFLSEKLNIKTFWVLRRATSNNRNLFFIFNNSFS